MQPNDNRQQAPIVVPPRQSTDFRSANEAGDAAAANLVRNQIDSIYRADPQFAETQTATSPAPGPSPAAPPTATAAPAPVAAAAPSRPAQTGNIQYDHQQASASNPYQRTHSQEKKQATPSSWDTYHSAWQSYYQQYYERYYAGQVSETKQALESQASPSPQADASISTDEALYDLRSKLRQQIETKATHVRKSRHFVPAAAAICVMLVFLLLQYNRVIFSNVAAYVSPGNMDPSTLIVDPSANVEVGPEPLLIIPKITVQAPIVWDAVASDQNSLNEAMNHGVVWFNIPGANARPGEKGNFVLSGHSSNDWMDRGDYKFIFARLEQVKEGDTIYVNYNSKRYTYVVSSTRVVKPTDVSSLVGDNSKPRLTLITCTPLGTALNRLLVFADQVSPDPSAATDTTETNTSTEAVKMPSNSPTFLQRIFGGGN